MLSRRFSSIYYKLPEEIQPIEAATMFHYMITLHPDLAFLLMERRPKSLQKMFDDAQDIQHNIQACKQIQNEELNAKENKSEYEQEIVDWNLKHSMDNIINPLEVSNDFDHVKNHTTFVKRKGDALASKPPHDKQKAGHFVDSQEDQFENQFVEKPINFPGLFLLDSVACDVDLSIYDIHEDDHNIEESLFRQYCGEQDIRSTKEDSLPLCFTTFKFLKENSQIIVEVRKCVPLQSHTEPTKQINETLECSYCWSWSLIIFLIQRSLLSAVFIPHEVFTPQKYVHSSMRGSAEHKVTRRKRGFLV
jgi:hypothetical protein